MTHSCNPNCLGGRDQEDGGSKPALANNLRELVLKISLPEMAGRVA
jgi:hypothetical protein